MFGTAGQHLQDGTARRTLAPTSTPSGVRHLKKKDLGAALHGISVGSLRARQIVKVSVRFDHPCFDAFSEKQIVAPDIQAILQALHSRCHNESCYILTVAP